MRFRRVGPSLVVHTPAKLNLFLEFSENGRTATTSWRHSWWPWIFSTP